jgi:signal transduction histidine kinase
MVSFYPQVMRGEGPNTPERALTWVLSILAGQVTVFALLLAAKKLWWHRPFARRHPAIAVWSLIGSIFVGVIVANIVASPVLTQAGSLSFGFEHLTLGSLTLIIVGSGVIAVREHSEVVARLQQTQASQRASIDHGEQMLTAERERTLRAIREVFGEAMEAVSTPSSETVSLLNAASENTLRPLSHELAYSTDGIQRVTLVTPTPRWRDVITQVTTTPLLAPRLTALVMLLLAWRLTITTSAAQPSQVETDIGANTVGVSIDLASLGQALLGMASVFIGTWLAASMIAKISAPLLRRFGPNGRWVITVVSVFAVAALLQGFTIALFSALAIESNVNYSLTTLLVLTLPIAAITALVGLLRAVSIAQMGVREGLDRVNKQLDWELARLNQRVWDQRRKLAHTVHGPVRAALISSAMELARTENTVAPEATERLQERLSRTLADVFEPEQNADPLTPLAQLVELWRGTCAISIHCDEQTQQSIIDDPIAAETACKIAEEACANAIMHGQATSIQIHLMAETCTLGLTVTNDGTPPSQPVPNGLGSTFIEEVSLRWKLASSDAGVQLTATLPLANRQTPQ